MAKVRAIIHAGPDDPIYKGGFVISSHPVRTKELDETKASKDDANKEKPKKQD
jgi:hypothetical protein